jgi:hypothetical protein
MARRITPAEAIERQRRGKGLGVLPVEQLVERAVPRTRTSTGAMQGADDPRYGSAKWQKLRAKVLRERPNCEGECRGFHRSRYADHVVEVRDDTSDENFFNEAGLAALCPRCHGRKTRREAARRKGLPEPKMRPVNCGVDAATGLPLSPQHWWNQGDD